jgi:Zinc finger C-x8-C-x5-C-x3-H type (and similar)
VKASKQPVKNPFSFSSMMADIGKPKDIPGPSEKPVEKRAPETEEERKKRERKESRRHLRVSFETDDKLEKVRLFEQYDEEKIRRGDNRAFSSATPEGIMHKMHKELEVDEEEEYEPPEEMSQLDWYNPAPTDLGRIATARLHDNTPRHGGLQPVESHEKSVQDDRERTKLITVYQSTADIPASAKSPPETMDDDFNPEVPFSEPISEFVRTREANERAKPATQDAAPPDMSTLKAILAQVERNRAIDRQNGIVHPPPQYPVSNYQAPASYYQAPATNYQAPAPYPNMQPNPQAVPNLAAITANLESIFSRFAEPKAPEPVAPGFDPSIQKALDVFKQQQATQTPQYQPQYQPPAQQYPAPPPAQPPSQNGQISDGAKVVAILESLKKHGLPQPNQGQPAPPAVPWQSQPVLPSYEAQPHNGYQPQQATQSYPSQSHPNDYGNDSGRKRAMEPDDQYQDAKRNKGEGKKLPPNYKTVVCSFYRKGSCKKGDACTYRHE